ncbi:MAG: hypothetical protein NPIRA06_25200 [Nitrospirales bacterium]|nr:MAG: hypothetical protein NPIRA06_25200 [Nitrospirales bacterium]
MVFDELLAMHQKKILKGREWFERGEKRQKIQLTDFQTIGSHVTTCTPTLETMRGKKQKFFVEPFSGEDAKKSSD